MELIITEQQEQLIINKMLSEATEYEDKVLAVKKYLDANFQRGNIDKMGDDGMPAKEELAVMLTKDKKPVRTMTDVQLFYLLQSRFKNILQGEERDKFLKKVLKAWYWKKITDNGNIVD